MFNYIALKAQLASIMGILSEAAVTDIIKVVEDSSAVFNVEVCRCRKENEELKRKLHFMDVELKTVRQNMRKTDAAEKHRNSCSVGVQTSNEIGIVEKEEEHYTPIEGAFERDCCQSRLNGGEPPADEGEYTGLQSGGVRDKYGKIEEEFKEESENSHISDGLQDSEESITVHEDSGGCHPSFELQPLGVLNSPVGGAEEMYIQLTPEKHEMDSDPDYTRGPFVFNRKFETLHKKPYTGPGKETEFICMPCGRNFLNFGQLEEHLSSHSARDQFCETEGPKNVSIQQQCEMNKCDYAAEKSFSSVTCVRNYRKYNLSMHGHVPTQTKPYNCNVCGKSFTQRQSLLRHKTVHNENGVTVFTCAGCGKIFTSKRYLKAHEFLHTGKKPFSCTLCNKSFSHKCNLYSHLRTHTGEKPFQCNECGKCFSQLGHLKRHRFVHSADKCV